MHPVSTHAQLAQLPKLLLGKRAESTEMGEAPRQRGFETLQMSYKAAYYVAKATWLAAALAMVIWLLYAGTPFWRYSSSFSSNLAFLVVAPALLALSSLGIVVLQPLCSKAQQHASIGIWRRVAAHLLPPR